MGERGAGKVRCCLHWNKSTRHYSVGQEGVLRLALLGVNTRIYPLCFEGSE